MTAAPLTMMITPAAAVPFIEALEGSKLIGGAHRALLIDRGTSPHATYRRIKEDDDELGVRSGDLAVYYPDDRFATIYRPGRPEYEMRFGDFGGTVLRGLDLREACAAAEQKGSTGAAVWRRFGPKDGWERIAIIEQHTAYTHKAADKMPHLGLTGAVRAYRLAPVIGATLTTTERGRLAHAAL